MRCFMKVCNCSKCGKIYKQVHQQVTLCRDCVVEQEALVREIYAYIQANPRINISAIAEHFELTLKDMEALLKVGELGTAKLNIKVNCTKCDAEIHYFEREGYYCRTCADQVKNKMDEARQISEHKQYLRQSFVGAIEKKQEEQRDLKRFGLKNPRPRLVP